jgi:menaquinone-9 beta-reductase
MTTPNSRSYDVLIAGGGPAGSSAAIRLAGAGLQVLLVERSKFPRQKLCGEFVSPECLTHFEELGITTDIASAGAVPINRTVFYSKRGSRTSIDNDWFANGTSAVGISRAEMDLKLLQRARTLGAEVLEDTVVTGLLRSDGRVRGLTLRNSTQDEISVAGRYIIDATGRRSLIRMEGSTRERAKLVGLKTHLRGASIETGACEIYSYTGGYGGCNEVENGLFNVCYIVRAEDIRASGSDLDRVMQWTLCTNRRAAKALDNCSREEPWLSVPIERFGRGECTPAPGLLAVGDAASFMDPFTGSGILLGLQSSQIAAEVIVQNFSADRQTMIGSEYARRYAAAFDKRLKISSVLRYAAFMPNAAEAAIQILKLSPGLGKVLARSTRSSGARAF